MRLSTRLLSIATAATLFTAVPAAQFARLAPLRFVAAPAYADEEGGKVVTVDGSGTDKNGAIADCRRNAVENALGAYVQSATDVKNFAVVKDEIKTNSEGYVSDTEVVDGSENQSGGTYNLKCKCTVSQVPLIKKLALSGALRAWRVAVLIKPPDKSDFGGDEIGAYREIKDATEQAETKINELLSDTGFKTINTGENPEVRTQILSHISDLNAMAAVASKIGMDVLIVGSAKVKYGQANKIETYGGLSTNMVPAVATLNLKAIKVSTREVIGAQAFVPTAENGNTIYTPGNGYGPAAAAAMQKSADVAGNAMLVKIAKLPAATAAMITVVVDHIAMDRADDVEDALKKVSGIASVHAEDWANGQVQYELKVNGDAKEAAKLVSKALEKLKLHVKSRDSAKVVASGK